ncbi:hypothetical protein [Enhygromyxa salina]|uniref:hypothetical protein n=1 Tax=Enhygromyxa salina TaxID=215803 RepID=UPI0011B1D0D8|nr:hypothetical protein [Enhygromyxa salina]
MKTIEDSEAGEQVARALLEGSGFAAFSFSTQFTLRFSRSTPGTFAGKKLPAEVELVLHGTWRFGEDDQWREHVARIAPPNAIEPDEPVQAWELAHLRWTEGANVESVDVASGALSIRFQNGRVLTASANLDDGDTAWILSVAGEPESTASWSVASAGGALFVREPA